MSRIKGKNNAALKGLPPLDRHGFELYGNNYIREVALFRANVKCATVMEGSANKQAHDGAAWLWKTKIFPRLQWELRNAIKKNDGAFFRALADCIDARARPRFDPKVKTSAVTWPADPLREWIARSLFIGVDGPKDKPLHTDKASAELHLMFRNSEYGYKVSFEVFTNRLREMGYEGKKNPGGAPRKKTSDVKPPS